MGDLGIKVYDKDGREVYRSGIWFSVGPHGPVDWDGLETGDSVVNAKTGDLIFVTPPRSQDSA
jgi:hypothetical protein